MATIRVLVPLAQGCEELEAVTVVDLLRRAEFEVTTAGLTAGPVRAARGTVLLPDTTLDAVQERAFDLIVLPGGQPGADHLNADARVHALLRRTHDGGGHVAAICAAPKVLATAGLLAGRQATAFPGVLEALSQPDIALCQTPVVIDGRIVTSRGPGTAMDFALALIERLAGAALRSRVEAALQRPVGDGPRQDVRPTSFQPGD